MARRTNTYDKELTKVQRLRAENQKLKKEIKSLRKEIKNLLSDRDKKQDLEELISIQNKESKKYEDKWNCHHCDSGILKLIILPMRNSTKYFRKCDKCAHRTKIQVYNECVKE